MDAWEFTAWSEYDKIEDEDDRKREAERKLQNG